MSVLVKSMRAECIEYVVNNKNILYDIHLTAQSGLPVEIVGASGSGKTSLLEILFGTITPQNKFIEVDGKIYKAPLYKTKNLIAFAPEYNFIPETLNLLTLANAFKICYHVEKSIEAVTGSFQQKFNQLSSGQKRFFTTMLIVHSSASIILLDEPFKGLAPMTAEKLKDSILEVGKQKIVILTNNQLDITEGCAFKKYKLTSGAIQELKQ